jgi:hypothetical protein
MIVTSRLFLAPAALLALASVANAQVQKPVTRSDFVKNLDAKFSAADANHDGVVTKAELTALQQHDLQQGKALLAQKMEQQFQQLDTNKDGKLSLQEFLAATPPLRTSETPDQLLQRLDTNHDGKVSHDEFLAPEVAKFNKVDANHDGVVTPAEIQAAQGRK